MHVRITRYSAKLRTIDSDPFAWDESTAARKAD
jgi:hypothetical protein